MASSYRLRQLQREIEDRTNKIHVGVNYRGQYEFWCQQELKTIFQGNYEEAKKYINNSEFMDLRQ